ncbi:Second ORF in transposon ISC1078 [Saccharolobus solfataricus P2]|uniref:Second ORF in transposon ISC1078 n=3 Tax=Saccharolobus solfataricus TaxID=2287 RepID=Q97XI7_SACS2|nr:Second ORF in transposon ISC1078 [Saccharolobus solfataricus P2]SAI85439.1 ORF2 in transposon ISC1078 [Saccharolobus solfataricus]
MGEGTRGEAFKKIREGYKVHIFDESYVSYINKGKGWMKVGGGIKVNPKRKRFAVVGGITISKEGITFSYSTYKKPSLNSKDIILYLRKVIKDEKTVIVMDNARIHGNEVREFLEENGVEFVYLPPYSPDKSPAEGPWAVLKKRLYSKIYTDFETLMWDATRFLRSISKRVNDLTYSVKRCGEPLDVNTE